jgi:Cytochrome C and Quinol oxidase polypeptide I
VIGALDMAFPRLNNLSFWLFLAGAALLTCSLFVGNRAGTRWTVYPLLSSIGHPDAAVDMAILAIRCVAHRRLHQYDQHHRQHARSGNDAAPDAAVRLVYHTFTTLPRIEAPSIAPAEQRGGAGAGQRSH